MPKAIADRLAEARARLRAGLPPDEPDRRGSARLAGSGRLKLKGIARSGAPPRARLAGSGRLTLAGVALTGAEGGRQPRRPVGGGRGADTLASQYVRPVHRPVPIPTDSPCPDCSAVWHERIDPAGVASLSVLHAPTCPAWWAAASPTAYGYGKAL